MHGGTTQESTPQGYAPFRSGSVVGERYEVIRQLDQDPLAALYECRDHEDDELVWVRVASPLLSPDAEAARAYATRLAPCVGVSGPHFSGLRAVDVHQGTTLFVVEPAAPGTSLAATLLSRSESRMNADELLPIMVQLAAALDACPPGRHHGEVRLDRITLDVQGRVQLTGAFLVANAPSRQLATVLRAHDRLRREFAPEVLTGVARESADLFAAGQVAYQALTGERACEPGTSVPARLGGVGDEIARLIAAHPRRRPPSLTPLLEALARQAGTAIPTRAEAAAGSLHSGLARDDDDDDDDRAGERTAVIRHPSKSSNPPGAPRAAATAAVPPPGGAVPVGTPGAQDQDDDDLDEDAKTRQVRLADLEAERRARAEAEVGSAHAQEADIEAANDEEEDDQDGLGRVRDEPTMKIAYADIKPLTEGGLRDPNGRLQRGAATLITRLPRAEEAGAQAGAPRPRGKRRRNVIVPALFAAVLIVAASLAFALFQRWQLEQDQRERVREHIEQLQGAAENDATPAGAEVGPATAAEPTSPAP